MRLSFILTYFRGKIKELHIEASRDNSRAISPFLRGEKNYIKLVDYLRDEDLVFFDSLRSIGMDSLPLCIPATDLSSIPVQEWASAGGRFFKRIGPFGSLKPISIENTFHNIISSSLGTINSAEIYVTMNRTYVSCRLHFRYVGMARPISSFPSSIPIRLDCGGFIRRNQIEEKHIIDTLKQKGIDIDLRGRFSLSIQELTDLVRNPPKKIIFLAKKTNDTSSTKQTWTASGIKWFGDSSDIKSSDFLDAYLENRNYVEINGTIGLFERDAIVKQVKQELYKDSTESVPDRNLLKLIFAIQENASVEILASTKFLRPYLKAWQNEGVKWLLRMEALGSGAILADEMGLGKTIQTIVFLSINWYRNSKTTYNLIICPASVVKNWQNEICRFEPELEQYVNCYQQIPEHICPGFIIITYERAVRQIRLLEKIQFDNIVLDEAQKVKNADTIAYRTLSTLQSKFRIMLTGTPVENTIAELWNHVSFVNPDTQGAMQLFKNRYPVLENMQKFCRFSLDLLSNFILIRKKSDVDINLPPLIETVVSCHMESSQRSVYESIRRKYLAELKRGTSARVSSLALEALLRLRQSCCLPIMLPPTLNSENIIDSCKLTVAFRLVLQETNYGRKVLVFSQFLEVIEQLGQMISDIGINTYILTGETTNRQELIDVFNSDLCPAVFLISLKAGGVGMNLATASCVILFDPWWNPAVENQSFARAHRIGQNKPVNVFKLICSNSIEEKMLQLQDKKKELASELTASNRPSIDEMMKLLL